MFLGVPLYLRSMALCGLKVSVIAEAGLPVRANVQVPTGTGIRCLSQKERSTSEYTCISVLSHGPSFAGLSCSLEFREFFVNLTKRQALLYFGNFDF